MRQILILALFSLVVAGCGLRGEVESRRFDLEWTVTAEGLPAGARSVVLWIPVPQERPEQRVVDPRVLTDYPWEWVTDPDFGNRMARVTILDPADTVRVRLGARVERYPVNAPVPESLSHDRTELFLREEALVSLSPRVRALADSLGKDARRRYDYVLGAMDYDKTVPGWGQGDTERACTVGKGNCTDYHSLFMSLCRAEGTPAMFEMGLATRPEGETDREGGYHCWAWFYRNGAWVPVDISEADNHPERADFYFGRLDPDRITFSRGRAVRLPGMQGPPVNYLPASAYVEVDGVPFDGVKRMLSYRPTAAAP
jgi:transglutaminase-like putative cysteine protease